MFRAAAAAAMSASGALRMPFAQRNIAALDHQPFAVYKAIRQLAAGVVVDQLHRCAGHAHLRGSLLLLQIFQIHQTDGFIFIQRHLHALCRTFLRGKLAERRQTADSAALSRSRHELFVTVTAAAVAAAGVPAIPVYLDMVTTLNFCIESEVFG